MSFEEENALVHRSLSAPNISPCRKFEKLYIESIKINRNTNLRRQISCEVIYDKSRGTKESTIRILDSPLFKSKNVISSEGKQPLKIENNSISAPKMKNSKESNEKCASNGKVDPDPLSPKKKQLQDFLKKKRDPPVTKSKPVKNRNSSKSLLITSFLIGLVSVGSYLVYYYYNYYNYLPLCKDKALQLENIKKDLLEDVTGQKNVLDTIISSFEQMGVWAQRIKVVPFVGSTGVGKTFIASLIKEHFDSQYVYEFRYTNFLLNIDKLKSVCCNLLIIDNLVASDAERVIEFINTLPKDIFIFVLPIFNVQGKANDLLDKALNFDDIRHIEMKFSESGLFYEIATFDFFTREEVNDWLTKELKKYKLDTENGDNLIKRLISETDFILKGLKGLHKEIFLELGKFYGKD